MSNKDAENDKEQKFPVIAIGCSANGLRALKQFFLAMPDSTGIAFIVTHHSDDQKGLLQLLKQYTDISITLASPGIKIQPNHIYITPTKQYLTVKDYQFGEGLCDTLAKPIDCLFEAIAKDAGKYTSFIILSGSGNDGIASLKKYKSHIHFALAQSPNSTEYSDMPENAIETGHIDQVLMPGDMPAYILNLLNHNQSELNYNKISYEHPEALQKIFTTIYAHTGHDFSYYKHKTIFRRIERRIIATQTRSIGDYVKYLMGNNTEVNTLYQEFLIGVTSFFRDTEAFDNLKNKLLPELFADKPIDYTFRIWVPGCSTGQEAYSIAILLRECMEETNKRFNVQIFATDIDPYAIEKARAGSYPQNVCNEISPERLERFFTKEGHTFTIRKDIREMLIFASQNIISDPPFTKLDMISCRNVLIYLNTALQKKLLPIFHYSLKKNGILLLGSSETMGTFVDLFSIINKKWKIFRKKESTLSRRALTELPVTCHSHENHNLPRTDIMKPVPKVSLAQLVDSMLLKRHMSTSVIINSKCDIIYIHGKTGKYLEASSGNANLNIINMSREGLKIELSSAIREVSAKQKTVVRPNLSTKNGVKNHFDLEVLPISSPAELQGLILVIFHEIPSYRSDKKQSKLSNNISTECTRLEELEDELSKTKSNLQTSIEELETSNEELKSANEELQSTNEELQSTNEELETSKEEQQSLNEELITVNTELQERIDQLSKANDDMRNLLDSTEIATIFLDNNLAIKRFTPKATQIINLIQSDVGRSISHIVTNLHYNNLVKDAAKVQQTKIPVELELADHHGDWYLMRIIPYRTVTNTIDGLVITFETITLRKKAEELLKMRAAIVEMMSAEKPLNTVFIQIIKLIEKHVKNSYCLITVPGKDKLSEYSGSLPKNVYDQFDKISLRPSRHTLNTSDSIILSDFSDQPNWKKFCAAGIKHGINASWSEPILNENSELLGVLTIYFQHKHYPTQAELNLVSDICGLIKLVTILRNKAIA